MRDPNLRRIRLAEIIRRRIANQTIPDIAQALNVSVDTIERELAWGNRRGMLKDFEDQIVASIIPAAVERLLVEIKSGKKGGELAFKALQGTGLFQAPNTRKDDDIPSDDELEAWMRDRRAQLATRPEPLALQEGAIDVQFQLTSGQPALAAGPAPDVAGDRPADHAPGADAESAAAGREPHGAARAGDRPHPGDLPDADPPRDDRAGGVLWDAHDDDDGA